MKRVLICLCLMLVLSACRTSPYTADGGVSSNNVEPVADHSHTSFEGDNVVEHDMIGYCGNTVTTVRCAQMGEQDENWERSFWGGTSVGLSDMLRWLDYKDEICRCLPEYYVKTEFSNSEYGVNLTQGYVRYEGKQTQLTAEQKDSLQGIFNEIASGNVDELCSLPPVEKRPVFD